MNPIGKDIKTLTNSLTVGNYLENETITESNGTHFVDLLDFIESMGLDKSAEAVAKYPHVDDTIRGDSLESKESHNAKAERLIFE